MTNIYIPPELLREIISYLFSSAPGSPEIGSNKPSNTLSPVSQASKSLRAICLEIWFRTFYTQEPSDIVYLREHFPQSLLTWTRVVHCAQQTHNINSPAFWDLRGFQQLEKIRLDWLASWIPSSAPSRNPTFRFDSVIRELEIRGLDWPSPLMFPYIHSNFPEIRVLHLWQTRSWCNLCHVCSVLSFQDPCPKEVTYEGGFGLPLAYSRFLAKFEFLATVHIFVVARGGGRTTLSQSDNPNLWAGECDQCMHLIYMDDQFRQNYVEVKKGTNGFKTSTGSIYLRPPALEKVQWRFQEPEVNFSEFEEDSSDTDAEE
ncbi:hypothetical protein BD779DRAFT_943611 [Infundibulicybe gibba]|nr:hypothetical protein BD779DRAFT_943611 [Infundibulicybe gibba]